VAFWVFGEVGSARDYGCYGLEVCVYVRAVVIGKVSDSVVLSGLKG